ncbi:hypothetical protein PL321_02445 [Caloramator sp. mosi_1]|uniref:hypothetical protein n=1 Tax=Caloramator sp. mosi_1 TaxID=3023090 RepID=UPI00235E6A39|nr:hypothetical protein [Caloramator sp. mosi_1]WDC84593.1 hypothetical protein PL321_02445 [Caloramator sp. mosi_1]
MIVKITENNKDRLYLIDIEKEYDVYDLSSFVNIDLVLKLLNLKENSKTIFTNYKYNDIYINYLDIKKLKLVYKDLKSMDYFYIDYKNKFKIDLSDIYIIATDDEFLYTVCRTGDIFKIYQIDVKNNVYNNIYKSNNLIEDIRLIDGELYFTELNIVNDISAYRLFKYTKGQIIQVCEGSM